MIKEAKNLVRDLAAAITPASLATNDVTPMDVNGSYDWNAQAYSYDVCKIGTMNQTSSQTRCGGGGNLPSMPDDTNYDSIGD
ncbi:MAG: hypothetical protein IJG38_06550 [Thermoguttaceae bacterium]|nr:hypothetical protein [Thermoguttaceae bacterium]MBQ6614971.1 hypothetical protein [Thermoguttaceae bacterium]